VPNVLAQFQGESFGLDFDPEANISVWASLVAVGLGLEAFSRMFDIGYYDCKYVAQSNNKAGD